MVTSESSASDRLGHLEIAAEGVRQLNLPRCYVRYGRGLIKARMTDHPFWTGQESDTLRLADDSFNVRVENMRGHIVGVMQFYGHKSYEMILVENDSLPPESEIAYRFTPGSKPLRGESATARAIFSTGDGPIKKERRPQKDSDTPS